MGWDGMGWVLSSRGEEIKKRGLVAGHNEDRPFNLNRYQRPLYSSHPSAPLTCGRQVERTAENQERTVNFGFVAHCLDGKAVENSDKVCPRFVGVRADETAMQQHQSLPANPTGTERDRGNGEENGNLIRQSVHQDLWRIDSLSPRQVHPLYESFSPCTPRRPDMNLNERRDSQIKPPVVTSRSFLVTG